MEVWRELMAAWCELMEASCELMEAGKCAVAKYRRAWVAARPRELVPFSGKKKDVEDVSGPEIRFRIGMDARRRPQLNFVHPSETAVLRIQLNFRTMIQDQLVSQDHVVCPILSVAKPVV